MRARVGRALEAWRAPWYDLAWESMPTRDKGPRIRQVPPGDNRQRLVCPDCDYVAYENPKVVVGVVATWDGQLLLCRRAIDPRKGFWTLPAGFMEIGETPEEGAVREAWEEARAQLEIVDLLALYSLRHISQLQLFFRARLLSPDVSAGPESQEVALFHFDDLPNGDLAFPSVAWAIDHYREARDSIVISPFRNPIGATGEIRRGG